MYSAFGAATWNIIKTNRKTEKKNNFSLEPKNMRNRKNIVKTTKNKN